MGVPVQALVLGHVASRAVHVAVSLGVLEELAKGSTTVEDLAKRTSTHAPSLLRLLNLLVSLEIVVPEENGSFALSPSARPLVGDKPEDFANIARFMGSDEMWSAWQHLEHSIRTGESGYTRAFGKDPFSHRAENLPLAKRFNAAMTTVTLGAAAEIKATYDMKRFGTIADIGGGNGTLLAELIRDVPEQRGILFDIPSGLVDAPRHLADAGVADRCTIVEGSFFERVPSGADAYVLKAIIYDWDDAKAKQILERCRDAMSESARLVVIESLMPEKATPQGRFYFTLDLTMLIGPGGRGRTEGQLRDLLTSAGLRPGQRVTTESGYDIVDATRA